MTAVPLSTMPTELLTSPEPASVASRSGPGRPPRSSFRTLFWFIPFVVGWTGAVMWLLRLDGFALREWLRTRQFWFLEVQFAAFVVSTFFVRRTLWRHVSAGAARPWLVVAGPVVLAILLAGSVAPRTNRIFYDEQIYEDIGQNLADLRLAQMCNEGTVEYGRLQCWRGEYNKQPYGWPYLLSVVYRLFGTQEWAAHRVNVAITGLLALVVAGLARLWFDSPRAGFFAALSMAVLPEALLWGHTAASEPSAALFAAIAVLAATLYVREPTVATAFWMAAAAVFALQFRTESLLVLIVIAAIVWTYARRDMDRRELLPALTGAAFLMLPWIGHLIAVRSENWGASGDRMSLAYVLPNLGANGWFYLRDERFPVLVTALALVGLVRGSRSRGWSIVALVYFAVYFGIFLLFYAGSYNYGADVRFALLTFPPLAVLSGAGCMHVAAFVERHARVARRRAAAIVVAIMLGAFLTYLPLVRATGEEAWSAREDVEFARTVAASLSPDAIVLTHNPNMFLLWGRNAAQASIASTDEEYVRSALFSRYAGGVFFHWNFWCNVSDPVQVAFCKNVLERYDVRLLREHRVRDQRFAFYQLLPRPH